MTATLDVTALSMIRDTVVPYDHQSDGVARLSQIQSWLNADEPGMGKSLLALMAAAIDFEIGVASKAIIICPATLKENWHHEII
ncbi:MAG: hypothetical protein KJN71_02970, partial [Acidimicrobiia bacterium]|nr:hypothetical protein [Acidimicrobiia bacterium]